MTRDRSLGVLTHTEIDFCRQNEIPLANDPMQIGWVPATATDDFNDPDWQVFSKDR
jgi:hypothetical protein